MSKAIDYRALFDEETADSLRALARELHDLLSPHPAPLDYRESLRTKLLAAANDESFYAHGFSRRLIFAMSVVVSALIIVLSYIAWRSQASRANQLSA